MLAVFGVSKWGVMRATGEMIPQPKEGQAPATIVVSRYTVVFE